MSTSDPPRPAFSQAFPWIESIAEEQSDIERAALISAHAADGSPQLVDALYDGVVTLARVDLRQAERLAHAAMQVALALPPGPAVAVAHRAEGHVSFLTGEHRTAIEHHQKAIEILEASGDLLQAARSRMNQIQPLTYLGRYDEAFAVASAAREVFLGHNDALRVARLDVNLANVFYRQDRFEEALALYESARSELETSGNAQDVAVLLRNMAVCHTSLNNFDLAAETYQQARDTCDANGFPLLVAEADYNVAYLHFLRGEYTRAIALYQTARQLCARLNNRYHMALCDLDLSELYLELNMAQEGALLAAAAYKGFEALGMHYEKAKALAFSAIAASQTGQNREALARFAEARALFVAESNRIWPGLIDFYRALVLFEEGRFAFAARLARSSQRHFLETGLQTKAALAEILLARLALQSLRIKRAEVHCRRALERLQHSTSPAVEFHAIVVLSAAQEALGQKEEAYASLQQANRILEDLRSQILGEAFRIGFLKDKLSIYQRLASLALTLEPVERHDAVVFSYMERAKSRSLADLISLGAHVLRSRGSDGPPEDLHVEDLRHRMTMAYRQALREEFRAERDSVDRIRNYLEESREYERQLALASGLHGGQDHDLAPLLSAGTLPLGDVQGSLAAGTVIVEYFEFGERLQAAVVDARHMRVVPLCALQEVSHALNLVQFQLSKYQLGPDHFRRFERTIQAATEEHLAGLYDRLIAPLDLPANVDHLVVVPHGCLHAMPFHALLDRNAPADRRLLMDKATVSYAPSASVYTWCRKSAPEDSGHALVLGIPDAAAPLIREEAAAVADQLPGSRLFLGSTATREILWQIGPESHFIHIATHGLFRKDNPMFSSIRLGNADLHPADFYSLRLSARLVTLSGCGTGLNAIVGGDEILGLVRGLLYAGAQAVLVSLWDISDAVTTRFMSTFYRELMEAPSVSSALRKTMQSIRATHPNPYYWAPFVLIGDAESPVFSGKNAATHAPRQEK